jgi:hypothetical protein
MEATNPRKVQDRIKRKYFIRTMENMLISKKSIKNKINYIGLYRLNLKKFVIKLAHSFSKTLLITVVFGCKACGANLV